MDIQGLKDKILQLAIQGKLVAQDPNDEPASVLLERIKEEREMLIKEGKIKKQKPLPEITEEEKPFEIPESWEWVRLGDITRICLGLTHRPEYVERGIPFLSVKDISSGSISFSNCRFIEVSKYNSLPEGSKPQKGDVLFGRVGTLGVPSIVDVDFPFGIFVSLGFLRPYIINMNIYLKTFMETKLFFDQVYSNVFGSAQINLNTGWLSNFLVPLPPLAEQKRIVDKVDQLFALIDELDSNKEELLEVINLTRNQVLQLAIQGKLVDQNPNDEPASVLLAKIKEERDKLVKEKKIKKQKPLPEITEEEKPFEIPESWEWVRLGEISLNIHYGYTASAKNKSTGIKMLRITDIQEGKVVWENVPYCEIDDSRIPNYQLQYGDILIARTGGTIGKSFLITDLPSTSVFASYLIRVQLSMKMIYQYISYYLNSNLYWEQIYDKSKGTGQPNVNSVALSNLIIPLPPLEEQKRIVEKVDSIMNMLDELEKELTNKI